MICVYLTAFIGKRIETRFKFQLMVLEIREEGIQCPVDSAMSKVVMEPQLLQKAQGLGVHSSWLHFLLAETLGKELKFCKVHHQI